MQVFRQKSEVNLIVATDVGCMCADSIQAADHKDDSPRLLLKRGYNTLPL